MKVSCGCMTWCLIKLMLWLYFVMELWWIILHGAMMVCGGIEHCTIQQLQLVCGAAPRTLLRQQIYARATLFGEMHIQLMQTVPSTGPFWVEWMPQVLHCWLKMGQLEQMARSRGLCLRTRMAMAMKVIVVL